MVKQMDKSQPSPSDVHVSSTRGRGNRVKPFLQALASYGKKPVEEDVKAEKRGVLEMMDRKRSKMPLPYNPNFLANLRADQVPRFLGCLTNPELCDEREVNVADLVAIQDRVDTEKVTSMSHGPDRAGGKLPMVVKVDGDMYIADGHHRVVAAYLRGDKKIRVRFKNLEPESNMMKSLGVGCTLNKVDEEQRLVYGWASVVKTDEGNYVIDRQNDVMTEKALQKMAHDFMLHARNAGEMHEKVRGIGYIVESVLITPDFRKAMGMPDGPLGWWIGMHVTDDDAWAGVKSGKYKGFSIGGNGTRISL